MRELSAEGLPLNVTAILSLGQVETWPAPWRRAGGHRLGLRRPGRRHGRDPVPLMARRSSSSSTRLELLWASPREVLNICQAEAIGCHIITMTHDLLAKLAGLGRELEDVSLDTVRMFHADAARRFSPVIISRTPLRITLGGGGTDLPSYYERFGGFRAVGRHEPVCLHRREPNFSDGYLIKYSALERTKARPIDIRSSGKRSAPRVQRHRMVSVADIPAGAGLALRCVHRGGAPGPLRLPP